VAVNQTGRPDEGGEQVHRDRGTCVTAERVPGAFVGSITLPLAGDGASPSALIRCNRGLLDANRSRSNVES